MASPTDILIESGAPLPEEPVILVVTLPNQPIRTNFMSPRPRSTVIFRIVIGL